MAQVGTASKTCRLRGPGRGARRLLATALTGAVALLACPAQAARIAVVVSGDAAPYRQAEEELKSRLTKLGHSVSATLLADFVKDPDGAGQGAAAFVAVGTKAAVWLNENLRPSSRVAYCMVADPETAGLTASCRASGVSINVPLDLQFKLIAEALPKTAVVGLLHQGKSDKGRQALRAVEEALPKGWRMEAVAIDEHESVAKAIEVLLSRKVDVVWTQPDSAVYTVATVRSLLLTAIRQKTPVFGFSPAFVRAGALLGVGIDPAAQAEQAADIVHGVLLPRTGATQPQTQMVHPPPRCQIAVNLVVARKLGVDLPEGFVKRAALTYGEEKEKQE